jgi:hypothetical protein
VLAELSAALNRHLEKFENMDPSINRFSLMERRWYIIFSTANLGIRI